MASTAALAANMRSFDDSAREGFGDRTGAGTSRMGGVSFGTDEASFHSDDYERDRERVVAKARRVNGKDRAPPLDDLAEDDEVSEEQPEEPPRRPTGLNTQARRIPSAVIAVGGASTPGGTTGHEGESTMLRALDQTGAGTSMDESSRPDTPDSPKRVNGAGRNGASTLGQSRAGKGNQLTLREQEKVIDEVKKENFNLKLKVFFLEDRLAKMAPDQVDQALKENIEIKVESQTIRQELKRYRRLLLEAEKAIESVKSERDDAVTQAAGANRKAGRGADAELRRFREDAERERTARLKVEQLLAKAQDDLRTLRRRGSTAEPNEDLQRLQDELEEERAARDELEGEYQDMRDQLATVQDALAEKEDELARLAEQNSGLRSSTTSQGSVRGRRARELEDEVTALRSQVNAQVTMLATRNGEKEDLRDEVESLKRTILELEDELDLKQRESNRLRERSRSGDDTDEELHVLQEELNTYRDKLAAALLEAERREKEIEELIVELDEREANFQQEVDKVATEYKGDLDDARAQRNELQDTLEERDEQVRELSEKLEDLIAMQEESSDKISDLEQRLSEKEEEVALLAEELEATQADLKDIGAGTRDMAQELADKEQEIADLNAQLDELEKEANNRQAVHDEVVAKLKQKHSTTKGDLSELTIQHESAQTEVKFLREKVEDFAMRHAEMDEQRRGDSDRSRRLEDQLSDLERALRDEKDERDQDQARYRREKREQQASWQQNVDVKQKALAVAEAELASIKGRLAAREDDLDKLQSALRNLEKESSRLTESQSNDRLSLELEVERLQRDLAVAEDNFEQARADADDARDSLHHLQLSASATQTEKEDLSDKLVKVQRARQDAVAKFDEQTKALRKTQDELAQSKARLQTAQETATSGSRQLSKSEKAFKDQLSERNTLLLTIYQHLDRFAAPASSSPIRRTTSADAKPMTNFTTFHENVMSKLKSVANLQTACDTRVKEVETRLEKQYSSLKHQHDSRMRQLDRFETTIKAAADVQRQWKQRVQTKQGEIDAMKATSAELQKQIDSLRTRASLAGLEPGALAEAKQAQTKASTLEKRLVLRESQLRSAEQKLDEAKDKVAKAETTWQSRLRELQERNRELEEKVKRERQGAKERVNELVGQVSGLKEQVVQQQRRGKQLDEVLKEAKGKSNGA